MNCQLKPFCYLHNSEKMTHPTKNKTKKQKIVWHFLIALFAIGISLVFSLVLQKKIFHDSLLSMVVMTFLQLHIFIWIGYRFFQTIKLDDPKYLKKMVARLVLFYLTVLVIAFAMFLAIFTYHFIKNGADFSLYLDSLMRMEMKSFFIATMIGFAFGAIFFFYSQWSEALKRMQKLKEEKLIFQYETLKSQVNPHFLFNNLNTLSSLVRTDVELSESFIQKLSTVYRYILENQDKEMVSLQSELEFVQNFFFLQKIRDQEKIELKIELENLDKVQIVPVSLQMLVENAVKHNALTRKAPLRITIHFEGMDKLVVRNDLRQKTQLINSSKIGLKNLNERCKLILGREIEKQETADEFIVKVPVKLN